MYTSTAKPAEVTKKWLIIDADGVILGRLASRIAMILRGKNKTNFTPNIDTGDHVVVINADKVKLTGKKRTNKLYHRHTGFPGGIKTDTPEYLITHGKGDRVIERAVTRMMPKESPLAQQQLTKLRVYRGAEHEQAAQKPEVYDFASANKKNKR